MNRTALSGPGRPSEEQAFLIDHDQDSQPFLTILTPQGCGAVAVVRVWGRGAVAVADAVFRPARGPGLARTEAGRLRLGRIGRGLGDEVVAVVIEEDPPVVEIQCHGGSAAVGLVVEARDRPVPSLPSGGLGRAHRESSIRADALLDLTRAPTLRTAEILLSKPRACSTARRTRLIEEIRGPHHAAPSISTGSSCAGKSECGSPQAGGW